MQGIRTAGSRLRMVAVFNQLTQKIIDQATKVAMESPRQSGKISCNEMESDNSFCVTYMFAPGAINNNVGDGE